MQGTGFEHPDPSPSHVCVVGDPASLPAVNSLLGALGNAPATIWFEGSLEGLPCAAGPARHERVRAELPDLLASGPDPYVWIACDTATTRALGAFVRKELGLPKQRVQALGYWRAS